jgi:hypothetical protein
MTGGLLTNGRLTDFSTSTSTSTSTLNQIDMNIFIKGIGLAVAFLVAIAVALPAQVSTGLRAGVHISKWHWEDEMPANGNNNELVRFLSGPQAAFPVTIQLGGNFALQPEVIYRVGGYRWKDEEVGIATRTTIEIKMKIDYLAFPVLAKGMLGNEKVRGFLVAGPEFAYALSGTSSYSTTITNGEVQKITNSNRVNFEAAHLHRWNAGLVFGAGVEIKTGNGFLILDARYNLGLTNLSTLEGENARVNARGFGIAVGYLTALGK